MQKKTFFIHNLSKLFLSFFPENDVEVFFVRMQMLTLFNCLSIQLILLLIEIQKQISTGNKHKYALSNETETRKDGCRQAYTKMDERHNININWKKDRRKKYRDKDRTMLV
jgi:hypothetical protein